LLKGMQNAGSLILSHFSFRLINKIELSLLIGTKII
ncbi:uncharacterized protein METZ01_LOCUS331922, partial [marine metagenome]